MESTHCCWNDIYLGLWSPLAAVFACSFAPQPFLLLDPHEDISRCQGAELNQLSRTQGELPPLSVDVEETWHQPQVSVTKLYYHNPIKCVWGLMSSSSIWEEGRWRLAVGGFVDKEQSQWIIWHGSLPALIFQPFWYFWLLCQMQKFILNPCISVGHPKVFITVSFYDR